ncbi:MAG: signal peptidase I, partial [bacterium]|nr:signal peptidase I [bacterium]
YFYRWAYIYDLYNFFMICISVFLLIMTYLFAFVRVSGPSMKPTYKSGDILACRSIGYKPKNNDPVIVYMKEITGKNELYVKRIVGVPGDVIIFDEELKTISVNGEIVEKECGYWYYLAWNNYSNTLTLGEKEYFIMGDNRGDSTDSRKFGPVKRSDIAGKVLFDFFFWR